MSIGDECLKRVRLTESCENDAQCPEGAACEQGACECPDDTKENLTHDQCLPEEETRYFDNLSNTALLYGFTFLTAFLFLALIKKIVDL